MNGLSNLVKGEWKGITLRVLKPANRLICEEIIANANLTKMLRQWTVR